MQAMYDWCVRLTSPTLICGQVNEREEDQINVVSLQLTAWHHMGLIWWVMSHIKNIWNPYMAHRLSYMISMYSLYLSHTTQFSKEEHKIGFITINSQNGRSIPKIILLSTIYSRLAFSSNTLIGLISIPSLWCYIYELFHILNNFVCCKLKLWQMLSFKFGFGTNILSVSNYCKNMPAALYLCLDLYWDLEWDFMKAPSKIQALEQNHSTTEIAVFLLLLFSLWDVICLPHRKKSEIPVLE